MDEFIPIVLIIMVLGIPIAAILTNHQRKMAEIIHKKQSDSAQINPAIIHELQSLRAEVGQMRDQMNMHTLEIEDLRSLKQITPEISQRIGE